MPGSVRACGSLLLVPRKCSAGAASLFLTRATSRWYRYERTRKSWLNTRKHALSLEFWFSTTRFLLSDIPLNHALSICILRRQLHAAAWYIQPAGPDVVARSILAEGAIFYGIRLFLFILRSTKIYTPFARSITSCILQK